MRLHAKVSIYKITPRNNDFITNKYNFSWFRAYGVIIKNPYTWKIAPLSLFNYAILVAIQTLWIGPWLTDVVGETRIKVAISLLWVNTNMLFMFMFLGIVTTKIVKSKKGAEGVLKYFVPLGVAALAWVSFLGESATWHFFLIYLVTSSVLALTHPAVGQNVLLHSSIFYYFLVFF